MSDLANYILWRRGSNPGYDIFYAKDDATALKMAEEFKKEWGKKLSAEHHFHLQHLRTLPLGKRNYVHRSGRSMGELVKVLAKYGPVLLKNKLSRKLRKH